MEINEDGTNAPLCLLIDSHIVEWNGSHTFNISWAGGHGIGEHLHCFTNNAINKNSSIKELYNAMYSGWDYFWYGE